MNVGNQESSVSNMHIPLPSSGTGNSTRKKSFKQLFQKVVFGSFAFWSHYQILDLFTSCSILAVIPKISAVVHFCKYPN